MLFPWKLICIAHPLGHKHHHEPGKPSPCELRKMYKGTAYWPPMDCHRISADTDNYQAPQKYDVKPTYQTIAIAAVLFEFVKITYTEQPNLFPPEPKCRSATIISVHTLRGPPLV